MPRGSVGFVHYDLDKNEGTDEVQGKIQWT